MDAIRGLSFVQKGVGARITTLGFWWGFPQITFLAPCSVTAFSPVLCSGVELNALILLLVGKTGLLIFTAKDRLFSGVNKARTFSHFLFYWI